MLPAHGTLILYGDFSSSTVTLDWRVYETLVDDGWKTGRPGLAATDHSQWTVTGGTLQNADTTAEDVDWFAALPSEAPVGL